MAALPITIACGPYDRVAAIASGEIGVAGCDVNYLTLGPEELFFRAFKNAEFDVCELSMSSYLLSLAAGTARYVAVPAFVSRVFRHSAIYVRADAGIERPQDMKGKRVGVPEYQMTAALWARGLLDDEYGVGPWDFDWFNGGIDEPNRSEKQALNLPPSINLSPIGPGRTLNAMLSAGELDALISPRAPRGFLAGDPAIRRLFPDVRAASTAYFRKTGLFPIMHVVGIRRDLVDAHPWLANSVYEAFHRAKEIALHRLADVAAFNTSLPFLDADVEEAQALAGRDFWPYGVSANRHTLETMIGYAHRHGTTDRLLSVGELFAPTTIERFKV